MKTHIPIFLVLGLWFGNLLPALDATLVGTALPTIVGNLNGLALYSWVFTGNILTFTISVPIFGKLADLYGRKPVFFIGTAIYLISSALSSLSQNIEQLILFRALAGIGLGAILPVSLTIVGDAFSLEQRASIQWVFASSWFLSSFVGPFLSSLVVLNLSWRLVFIMTFPLAMAALLLLGKRYHEKAEHHKGRVDYVGVLLLAIGMVSFLLAVSLIRGNIQDSLVMVIIFLVASLVFGAVFVWNERRVSEPILPAGLLLIPMVGASVLANFLSGVVQLGATSFLPLFVQGAQGGTAANAGAALAPLTVGWPLGAAFAGRLLLKFGFKKMALLGMGLILFSQIGFLLLGRTTPLFFSIFSMFILGLGFGFSTLTFTISVQEVVEWNQRGIATASLQFFRSIGGSLGVGIMGTILAFQMQPLLAAHQVQGGSASSALLDPKARAALSPDALAVLQNGLADTLHNIFVLMALVALVGFVVCLRFPVGKFERAPAPQGATTLMRAARETRSPSSRG